MAGEAAPYMDSQEAPSVTASNRTAPLTRYYGFDYVRAFFCLGIVALHTNIAGPPTPYSADIVHGYFPSLADILYFNVMASFVPAFFLMSFFLYASNYKKSPDYFPRRMRRLLSLYLFWTCVFIFLLVVGSLRAHKFDLVVARFASPMGIVELIMTGGGQLYYYFFSLLVLTPVLHWSLKILKNGAAAWGALIVSAALLPFIPILLTRAGLVYQWWYPVTFLPYVFSGIVVRRIEREGKLRTWAIVFALLALIFVIPEWHTIEYYHEVYIIPIYSRISLVFTAMAVQLGAMHLRHKPPSAVRFLSDYSLGIYCLHIYMFSTILLKLYKLHSAFVIFASRVIDAVILTKLMKKTKWFRRFV